jgi:MoxR-like ATPase
MSDFHIVKRTKDWAKHDQDFQADALKALSDNAAVADERELSKAAERFQPSDDLLLAINAAIAARVPLLLTGEPGTGKTQVAWFLKRYFKIELFEYQVRSGSQATDLRYDFDAVAYLRDAYLAKNNDADQAEGADKTDPRSQPKYLKPGVLWNAYQHDGECLVLIDEIDKAPRDFPNDLLQELDQHRFAHPFHSDEFIQRKGAPPLILLTSNGERRLPDAFLRRCIVHHITLTKELLTSIMQAWQQQFPSLDEACQQQALKRFQEIRKNNRLSKKPGAAELLLWLSVLSAQNVKAEALADEIPLEKLPALVCLIKDHADYNHL